MSAMQIVMVNEFTNGVLDPKEKMLGPVRSGGRPLPLTGKSRWA